MRRREFNGGIAGAAAWPLVGRAQQPERMRRIGWLVTGSPDTYRQSLAAFREGLRSEGFAEGQNVELEYKWADGDSRRLPSLANELVQLNVEVILAGGSTGAAAVGAATQSIPIVSAGG